jgi:hypothetical protein
VSPHDGDTGDRLDRMIVEEQLDWAVGRISELESGIALLGCATLTAQVPIIDPVALADAVATRVAELLRQEQQLAPLLVDVAGAARLLGISEDAFRSRIQRGQIPRAAIVHTGTRLQFRPERLVRDR